MIQVLKKTKGRVRPALSRNIQAHRSKMGWNQQELADRIGAHLNTIKAIEGGRSEGTVARREKIAKVFGVDLAALYADESMAHRRGAKVAPSFDDASKFLALFEGLPPERKALVSMLVYDEAAYLADNPDLARAVVTLLED